MLNTERQITFTVKQDVEKVVKENDWKVKGKVKEPYGQRGGGTTVR